MYSNNINPNQYNPYPAPQPAIDAANTLYNDLGVITNPLANKVATAQADARAMQYGNPSLGHSVYADNQ